MSWGFERGVDYIRREHIHVRFGGQQQGGIIAPRGGALVIAITGESGLGHGYHDRELPDGTFEYFGAGQTGPMKLTDRNKALLEHSEHGKSLLLFRQNKKLLRFVGEYVCVGMDWEDAPDREGNLRPAIVFKLIPLEKLNESIDDTETPTEVTASAAMAFDELRQRAMEASKAPAAGHARLSNVYERSRIVRDYVLRRAGGRCEFDGQDAPFLRPNGEPYLEPHHIERLSDGGPDHPSSIIALCPNCHRRAHSGADREALKSELRKRMEVIEPDY